MNVADWLRQLGLELYEAAFRENDVTPAVLPSLTAEDLKDLGVISVGHRRQLLDAIAALRAEVMPAANPTQGSLSQWGPAERRLLSVMFCDVIGSTAMSYRLDPEDLSSVIRDLEASSPAMWATAC
jgi:class 3 adenylate cyclase